MNYLDELKNNLLQSNKNLEIQKETFLKKFIDIDINNVLSQINDNTINFFRNILDELSLTEEELSKMNKAFQYYDIIKGFEIDINSLFFEDKNIKEFKDTIFFICQSISDYKNNICSNIDLEINRNNIIITTIIKIKELINDDIDLDNIYDLINSLPISNDDKEKIYKEIYLKQISNLKKNSILIEEPSIIEEIIEETNDFEEVEENIEEEGIRVEITEEDKELRNNVELLCDNLRKLKNKMQSIEITTEADNNAYVTDKVKLNDIMDKSNKLKDEMYRYLSDKDIVWNEEEFNEEELNAEFTSVYNELIRKHNEYNQQYLELYAKYNTTQETIITDTESIVTTPEEEYPPIIFWMGNTRLIGPNNLKRVDEALEEIDNYPESNFYGKSFLPALKAIKKSSSSEKPEGIETDHITDYDIPFWEVKLHPGKGGTTRIYYDYIKSQTGKEYKVIYAIVKKKVTYDKDGYEKVQKYLKEKVFLRLPELLDDEEIISKFQTLEDNVFEKINKRIEKEKNKQIEKAITQDEQKKAKKAIAKEKKEALRAARESIIIVQEENNQTKEVNEDAQSTL